MSDLHHFNFLELMLANETSHVFAVGAGLAAKTGCVGRVLQRQLVAVENFVAMEIRQRHFRRRDEEQIPLAGDLEEIRLELRQLASCLERRAIHEKRRRHLEISMLPRMKVEHEVGQRP